MSNQNHNDTVHSDSSSEISLPSSRVTNSSQQNDSCKSHSSKSSYLNLAKAVKLSNKSTQTDEELKSLQHEPLRPQLKTVVKWSNIEVEVSSRGETKKILDNISGQTTNLEIMAILGPSGAGKSTLLNTIAGRQMNYRGSVKFYSNEEKIGFAYVPQIDQLSPYLTIKECLLYASKFKNPKGTNHGELTDTVIDSFNLNSAKHHYTTNCSGGERKRLSIALEMINKPKILLLDEPTTGLDSTTALVIIDVLKKINKDTVIITTIHQPNTQLFNLFERVYIMSNGRCLYNGPPANIVDHLESKFKVNCPTFTAPADLLLDIANCAGGKQEARLAEKMADYEQEEWKRGNDLGVQLVSIRGESSPFFEFSKENLELREIQRLALKREHSFCREYRLNLMRMFLGNARDPHQTIFRALTNINFPILLYIVMAYRSGTETGCAFIPLNETTLRYEDAFKRFNRQLYGTRDFGSAVVNLMFCFFSSIISSTTFFAKLFPLLHNEMTNSYYSPRAFLCATLTVTTCMALIYGSLNTFSYFFFTAESADPNKMLKFGMIMFISGVLGDLFGLFFAIIFAEQYITGIICGSFLAFSLFNVAGFFIPVSAMTKFMRTLSEYAFTRHLLEALVRVLYGGVKCRVKDGMVFTYRHLVEFIKYFNYENRNTFQLQEIGDLSTKVREALKETVWNRSTITEFVVSVNNLDDEEVRTFNDFWDYRTSYLLNSFGITHSDLTRNVNVLLVTIAVAIVCGYSILVYRLRK